MIKFFISFLSIISISFVANAATCKNTNIPKHLSGLEDEQRKSTLMNTGWMLLDSESDEALNYYEFSNRMPSWCNMVSQCWEIYKDSNGRVLQLYRPDGVESAHLYCGKKRIKINVE
jgi:hypothetical protein